METQALPSLTVSGYRGIWGETLTPAIAAELASAFAHFVIARAGKRVIIGRDARVSGPEINSVIIETLTRAGLTVTDLGIAATPAVLFLTRDHGADGAIVITASHNPIEYNGLKFVTREGVFLTESEVRELGSYLEYPLVVSERVGTATNREDLLSRHREQILKHTDCDLIRKRKFKVVLDPINSVGAIETPKLLESFGCDVVLINEIPNGLFAHEPEPLPKNLGDLARTVRDVGADIGFAQDPDGDRLVLVDEHGEFVSEEHTLPLCILAALSKTPGDIVINLSSSNVNEDIALRFGKKTYRTKVGESNVLAGIVEHNAMIGGEGGGGVIYPTMNPTRDSFVGIALILELLARQNTTLSTLIQEFPRYVMIKEKFPVLKELSTYYSDLTELWKDAKATTEDGIRLDWPDRSWIHIRQSNTEPIIRVMGEATNEERIRYLIDQTTDFLYGDKYLTRQIK